MARSLRGSSLLGGGLAGIVPLLRNTRFEVFPASGVEDAVAQWVPADQTVTVTASPAKGLDATLGLTERLAARAELVVADISIPMPFLESSSFDIVVASLVLHYLADWRPLCTNSRESFGQAAASSSRPTTRRRTYRH